ncbi:hypothetical protein F53441_13803 [Fusarium austroafricanum]|uniref:Uncharacterized protein n=1 Tax=Fusarium austroafricanum TaxID=2364996 RepID=A0A8H4NDY0_9HYPO|nr:hypothetical protein F53441_13803 [Fusarium austroafricanum]
MSIAKSLSSTTTGPPHPKSSIRMPSDPFMSKEETCDLYYGDTPTTPNFAQERMRQPTEQEKKEHSNKLARARYAKRMKEDPEYPAKRRAELQRYRENKKNGNETERLLRELDEELEQLGRTQTLGMIRHGESSNASKQIDDIPTKNTLQRKEALFQREVKAGHDVRTRRFRSQRSMGHRGTLATQHA